MAIRLGLSRREKSWFKRHYTPGQRVTIRNIAGEAQRRYAPGGYNKRERRIIRAALQTGRPESNYYNLTGGDADSGGWRQERRSLYADVTNLKKSVPRFFNEAEQHYHGQTAGELAADVQRPAAQYRGRYALARAEGINLLRHLVLGKEPGGGHGGSSSGRPAVGSASSLRDLIGGGPQRTPVAGSAPPDPPFSARINLKLPESAGDVPGSEVPGPKSAQLGDLAKLLRSTPLTPPVPAPGSIGPGGVAPPAGGFSPRIGSGRPTPLNPRRFQVGKSGKTAVLKTGRNEGEVVVWSRGRWRFARGGKPVTGLRWRPQGGSGHMGATVKGADILGQPYDRPGVSTSRKVRRFSERLSSVLDFPLHYGTGTQHNRYSTSGNESEHWRGNAIDLPLAGRQLRIAGTKALRLVGLSRNRARRLAFQGGLYNITYKGRRYQIIFRTDTGGNHWDHLHVGIQ